MNGSAPPTTTTRRSGVVTLGQALENLRAAAPPPGPEPLPASSAASSHPAAAPAAPLPGAIRDENRSFAKLTAYVATNVGVLAIGDHLRKQGLDPNEPSDEDLEQTTDATADAIVRALGDAEVPWWGALAAAWGNLYLAMRMGARKLEPAEGEAADATTTETTSSSPAAPARAVLGQGVPQRRAAATGKRGVVPYRRLPRPEAST